MTQLEIERHLLSLPREEVEGTPLATPLAQLRQAQADDNFEAEMALVVASDRHICQCKIVKDRESSIQETE